MEPNIVGLIEDVEWSVENGYFLFRERQDLLAKTLDHFHKHGYRHLECTYSAKFCDSQAEGFPGEWEVQKRCSKLGCGVSRPVGLFRSGCNNRHLSSENLATENAAHKQSEQWMAEAKAKKARLRSQGRCEMCGHKNVEDL